MAWKTYFDRKRNREYKMKIRNRWCGYALITIIFLGSIAGILCPLNVYAKEERTEELADWLGEQMTEGQLTTEQDIRAAIELGEEKFGIIIPEEMTQALVKSVVYMQSAGLGTDFLVEEMAKLLQDYGSSVITQDHSGFWDTLWSAITDFFANIWKFIVDFVSGLIRVIFG